MIGGVDECNKGEALGNLIVCCVYTNRDLKSLGYHGESKSTIISRSRLFALLKQYDLRYVILQWPPSYVDAYNINYLLYLAHVYLIRKLKLNTAYIDSMIPLERIDKLRLLYRKHTSAKVVCEPHLDERNVLVGLASLIAKQRKKDFFSKIQQDTGFKLGSGNLNDKSTQAFIRKTYPDVPLLRRSWPLDCLKLPGGRVAPKFRKPKFI